jgi:hypothetical protein
VKIRTSLLAAVSALALLGGFAVPAASASVHPRASTPHNVLNDHVTCNTLTGTIKFATKLTATGPTTGGNTITVKATVSGCTDDDNGAIPVFSGALTGTLTTSGGTSCGGLLGPGSSTGSTKLVWKNPTGHLLQPTDPVTLKPTSVITINQNAGGLFTVPAGNGPWSGTSYGLFQIGTVYGTTPASQTGATNLFKGSDSGATGWFSGTTNADAVALLTACNKGLAGIAFGIGSIALG